MIHCSLPEPNVTNPRLCEAKLRPPSRASYRNLGVTWILWARSLKSHFRSQVSPYHQCLIRLSHIHIHIFNPLRPNLFWCHSNSGQGSKKNWSIKAPHFWKDWCLWSDSKWKCSWWCRRRNQSFKQPNYQSFVDFGNWWWPQWVYSSFASLHSLWPPFLCSKSRWSLPLKVSWCSLSWLNQMETNHLFG